MPVVTINNPTKVNFTVFSDGAVKADLKITNVSFAIAKLVPGANGDPDQWVNYIYRTETAAAGVGPGTPGVPVLATAKPATTDGKQTDTALLAAQLVYNPDGYYTYTFKTDITDITKTNGVVFQPTLTHRVAIQLSYKNAKGEAVLVNPYFDFTVVNGTSVAVTDPAKTRKMTDVASCNGCHEKLALHGGGRVDTQFCVMCHNPGTTDANSGNNLNLSTMVHKIHAGKRLKAAGEDYTIWGYQNSKNSYAEVGFPQDLRNCTVCHSAKDLPNQQSVRCHEAGVVSPERVHWNQNEENAAKYKMNIESATFNDTAGHKARSVTVKYFLSDPTNGNAAYNLVTSDCASTTVPTCGNTTKFGNLRFYLAYQNMVGQLAAVTEFSAYNNGGSSANAYAYRGSKDGNNHYTVSIPVPDDTPTAVASGTARVVSIGQIKEPKLEVASAADPRPEVAPRNLVNTVVQHTYQKLALRGALQPRRAIVSNEKCNVCHDANRVSSTIMTNGLALNESYPFTHGNTVVGAFNKDGTSVTGGTPLAASVVNYAAEVAWLGVDINCNACHVDNSYKTDKGTLGAVVQKDVGVTDSNLWKVISPKAATCMSCHDSSATIAHVTNFGGATFGDKTQAEVAQPRESCDDCHASGGVKSVDTVHGRM